MSTTRKTKMVKTGLLAAISVPLLMAMSVSAFAAGNMQTGAYTTQPIGHYEFCKSAPQECKRTGKSVRPHHLTRESWAKIVDINNAVNTEIEPLTDMEIWGEVEVWSYPTSVGDCEDYVLLKRRKLIKAGFKPSNLLITVVKQRNGDGHAVLTVRTDRGDFILDNLVGRINDWRDTPYTYLKRQSTDYAGRWVTIQDNGKRVAQN